MGKFAGLYDILCSEGLITKKDVVKLEPASWQNLGLVHGADFLFRLRHGLLDRTAERRMGLPWTRAIVKRSRVATQGTILAGRLALEDGLAANLAGGMHHGYPDHSEGFCVLNDVAVAVRTLQRENRVRRVLIVDLDVHQGNGNAAIFEGDDTVFTFSMHGARNYPFRKERSDLDVALDDGTSDSGYLGELEACLDDVIDRACPDLIFYLAGVDPVSGDRFGKLALTRDGLGARDQLVLEAARTNGIPLAIVLSGGYAASDMETADLHAIVHRVAAGVGE
tara:strand:+ start:7962 stop:8801 length:840 start_codon:yes stop_codon:yes gene_type:complete